MFTESVDDDGKFVAADPRDNHIGRHLLHQTFPENAQHVVTHVVPECIVNRFEVIQVDLNKSGGPDVI